MRATAVPTAKMRLPIYDDFGNHIEIPPETRTYERKTGCWNCVHSDAGAIYQHRVQEAYIRDRAVFETARGMSRPAAHEKADVTRQMLLAKAGIFVVCTKGQVADMGFVACKHLCEQWSGKVGVMGALSPGEKLDEVVQALYVDHGEKPEGGAPDGADGAIQMGKDVHMKPEET